MTRFEEYDALMRLGLVLRKLCPSSLPNGVDHMWVISMGPKTDDSNEPTMMWSVNGNTYEVDGGDVHERRDRAHQPRRVT